MALDKSKRRFRKEVGSFSEEFDIFVGVVIELVMVYKALDKLQSRIYEIVMPISIQIERYGDSYLVTDEDVNRHGLGSSIEGALQNYEEILLSYFESLSQRQERLSPRLRQDFEFLRRTILRT